MTESEYKKADGIRRSDLWRINESPQKFMWAMNNPEPPSQALIFGAVVHKLLLEPETFDCEFAIIPDCDRRTKEGKAIYNAFLEEITENGKSPISADEYQVALDMVQAARETPFVERLLDGMHEQAFFWADDLTEELCKSRIDCVSSVNGKPVIVEYKTTTDARTEQFMRTAISYGYDMQAAMQIEALKNGSNLCRSQDDYGNIVVEDPTFIFIVQEKKQPYMVNILTADPVFVEHGYNVFRELIGIYHDCKVSGEWYGYLGKYETINNLGLPAWLAKELSN